MRKIGFGMLYGFVSEAWYIVLNLYRITKNVSTLHLKEEGKLA